jgi:cell division protein FtsB
LNVTTLGVVLTCVAGLIGSGVVYVGKRGENATTRFNSVTDQVQEENATLRGERAEREARIDVLEDQRRRDLETITRLRIQVIQLGGNPDQ